jgi:rubrerythrin
VKQLSPEWWATVSHEFQAHVREEQQFLDSYRELVDAIDDPATRLLIELIIEDEERHHGLMARLAEEVRNAPGGNEVTAAPRFSSDDVARLLEPTERFLEAERDDRRRLRALAKALEPLGGQNVWPLIVELMEIDTRKHVRILEYVRWRLRQSD